jgi:8-oxo-dGTP pyrophosphatase MutT (NUDIX family)
VLFRSFIRTETKINYGDLLQDKNIPADKARGFFIAAIRETFEEVGILLGGNDSGNFISFSEPETLRRFAQNRQKLNGSQITLGEIARRENVFLFTESLIPYAHWITPEIEKTRFSARFFLAKLPEGQTPIADPGELAESLWLTPNNALAMHLRREILLMPPTLKIIEELSAYSSITELFKTAQKKTIYPIMPQITKSALLLPHDPEYNITIYKRPPDPDEPSRIIIQDGVWKIAFANK